MSETRIKYFGEIKEISTVTGFNGSAIMSIKMHCNFERFGYAENFNDLMFDSDIVVILVGKDVLTVSKKLTQGAFCEVYGSLLDINRLDIPDLEEQMITKYVLTDNIAIHRR